VVIDRGACEAAVAIKRVPACACLSEDLPGVEQRVRIRMSL